ncbi:MAG: hypothetical protein QXG00_03425 [Candidatus Woesearchaeota archaeon]
MVQELEKIAGSYKTNTYLKKELGLYKGNLSKPIYSPVSLARSVEYDCDCGDSCDGDGCDGGSCDGGDS